MLHKILQSINHPLHCKLPQFAMPILISRYTAQQNEKTFVLGLLLFLTLISNITEEFCDSLLSSFTNNTRIGYLINDSDDIAKLQTDLNSIFKWNSTLTNFNVLNMGKTRTLSAFPIIHVKITSS